MCGRSTLNKTAKEIEDRFNAIFDSDELEQYKPLPNFNVAPSHMLPIINNHNPDHIQLYRWGLSHFGPKTNGLDIDDQCQGRDFNGKICF